MYPLDRRWLYYEDRVRLLNERRADYWANLSGNEFLIAVPRARKASESLPVMVADLVDLHHHDRGSVAFPLEILTEPPGPLFDQDREHVPNVAPGVVTALRAEYPAHAIMSDVSMVRELFLYCLAILHAPAYQTENREALSVDWARVPVPRSENVFSQATRLGALLRILLDPASDPASALSQVLGDQATTIATVRLHHGQSVSPDDLRITESYFGSAAGGWVGDGPVGSLRLNDDVEISGVPRGAWDFRLGGYPVLKKWIGYREAKRRDGAGLSLDELAKLREIIRRVSAVVALHDELDSVYDLAAQGALPRTGVL